MQFVMEEFGKRPDDGSNPIQFPEVIGSAMLDADVSFYCAGGKKGELQSFRIPMIGYVEKNERLRHAHMPGINDELMCTGMSVDYAQVQEMCRKVLDIVGKAREIPFMAVPPEVRRTSCFEDTPPAMKPVSQCPCGENRDERSDFSGP